MIPLLDLPTNVPEAVSTGYQRQNTLAMAVYAGHLQLILGGMDTAAVPNIQEGSIVEVNGNVYKAAYIENIGGTPQPGYGYIYAVPSTGGCTFSFSQTPPAWNSLKGGWYNGNNRAVARFYGSNLSGGAMDFNNKVILRHYKDMYRNNPKFEIPSTGGGQIGEASLANGGLNQEIELTLPIGLYRAALRGGKGGNGGNYPGFHNEAGEAGSIATEVIARFEITRTTKILISAGGDGAPGENGVNRTYGASSGGGGAAGGISYIAIGKQLADWSLGGKGGNGGGMSRALGGTPSLLGLDGNNGAIGNKGDDYQGGGDHYEGGAGGAGGAGGKGVPYMSSSPSRIFNNSSSGGDGGDGASGQNGMSGLNSPSTGATGGAGGSGTINTSGGYVRVYRVG